MPPKSGSALVIAVILCPLFAIGAGWFAFQLIRSNRAAIISVLPVLPEQTVALKSSGEFVVSVEVPRFTTDYHAWELEVTEGNTRRTERMQWSGPRMTGTVKGFSTIKVPIGRLTLADPDTLTLRIKGLIPDKTTVDSHIVLSRPYLLRMALQIIGIVFCGVGSLLSLLWALWNLGLLKSS